MPNDKIDATPRIVNFRQSERIATTDEIAKAWQFGVGRRIVNDRPYASPSIAAVFFVPESSFPMPSRLALPFAAMVAAAAGATEEEFLPLLRRAIIDREESERKARKAKDG